MNGNRLEQRLEVHKDRKVIVCEGEILECRLFVLEMIFRDKFKKVATHQLALERLVK